jgi:16S rRNA (guanine1207-N2)-methyltransferase
MLLLETLLPLSLGENILDLGCGYGPIGLTIALFNKNATVTLADINTRALALSKKNAQNLDVSSRVTILQSNIYENIEGPFDSILINPPIRAGKVVTYEMYRGAKDRLIDGGSLFIVIRKAQGALSAKEYITELFGNCTLLERHKGYHIYQAKKTNEEI